jgi:Leucine-rich repeat (LRR) protein
MAARRLVRFNDIEYDEVESGLFATELDISSLSKPNRNPSRHRHAHPVTTATTTTSSSSSSPLPPSFDDTKLSSSAPTEPIYTYPGYDTTTMASRTHRAHSGLSLGLGLGLTGGARAAAASINDRSSIPILPLDSELHTHTDVSTTTAPVSDIMQPVSRDQPLPRLEQIVARQILIELDRLSHVGRIPSQIAQHIVDALMFDQEDFLGFFTARKEIVLKRLAARFDWYTPSEKGGFREWRLASRQTLTCARLFKFSHCSLHTLVFDHGYEDYLGTIVRCDFPLRALVLDQCLGIADTSMLAASLPTTSMCHAIEFLSISNCTTLSHHAFSNLSNLSSLRYLKLSGCQINNAVLLNTIRHLVSLQHLNLSHSSRISGNGLTALCDMKELIELDISNCTRLQACNLKFLASLPQLQKLWLRSLNLCDANLASLVHLHELVQLELYGSRKITDGILPFVQHMHKMQHLCVAQTSVTGAMLREFLSITPNLTVLHLTQADCIDDSSLEEFVPQYTQLEVLKMRRTYWVTDILIQRLSLSKLKRINVNECADLEFTQYHIKALAASPNLERFEARSTAWTEDGFASLSQLASLKYLDVSRCLGPIAGDFVVVAELPQLRHLDLSFCELDSSDMSAIGSLHNLSNLRLKGCSTALMEGHGMMPLANLTSLTALNLSQSDVPCAQVCHFLPKLEKLRWLHMKHCSEITHESMLSLSGLPHVRHVNVEASPNLCDESLAHLSRIRTLTSLDVSNIPSITTLGLLHLCKLPHIHQLNLSGLVRACTDQFIQTVQHINTLELLEMDVTYVSSRGVLDLEQMADRFKTRIRLKREFGQKSRRRVSNQNGRSPAKRKDVLVLE